MHLMWTERERRAVNFSANAHFITAAAVAAKRFTLAPLQSEPTLSILVKGLLTLSSIGSDCFELLLAVHGRKPSPTPIDGCVLRQGASADQPCSSRLCSESHQRILLPRCGRQAADVFGGGDQHTMGRDSHLQL